MHAEGSTSQNGKQKNIRKARWFWGAVVSLLILAAAAGMLFWPQKVLLIHPTAAKRAISALPAGICEVHVIDVGQGASILVRTQSKNILVDGGERAQGGTVVNYLKELGVTQLDFVIASHHHTDHIGGLIEVFEKIKTKNIIMPDVPEAMLPTNSTYFDFLNTAEESGAQIQIISNPQEIVMGEQVALSVVGPFLQNPGILNDTSLVVRVDAIDISFLLMGDAEASAENALLQSNIPLEAEILIAGHHGGATSSSAPFLARVSPRAAIISVGAENPYGHPHREALARLQNAAWVYRTDLNKTVVCVTDGSAVAVSTHQTDTVYQANALGRVV
jgi:beta-lactamase superfamily II metal-dependent hydrolase